MKTFTYKKQNNGVDSWIVTNSDGTKYISYISPIELYKKEVNDYHNTLLENVLKQHNYISIGEVSLWLQTDYNDEAHSIINWWKLSSEQVMAHLETITEYKDSLDFCLTITKF
jgi:RNase P/RNase MRP subunit POP5